MTVNYGELAISVDLAPGKAGMWWYSFEVPNYAGKGTAERFYGNRGHLDRKSARRHAVEAVHAEIVRHFEALGRWDTAGAS